MSFDAIGPIQRAYRHQLQPMMSSPRANFQGSQPTPPQYQAGDYGFSGQQDTVSLGGRSYGPAYGNAYMQSYANNDSYGLVDNYDPSYDGNVRMPNGQTLEELFNSPFANDPDMAYLQEALDKIAAAKVKYGWNPSNTGAEKEAQKGDLRVIAGDRTDGVKAKEIRIDDVENWEHQDAENSYEEERQEASFRDGTVGREYDVTVTWADGSTTKKRVTLNQPDQVVYVDSAY